MDCPHCEEELDASNVGAAMVDSGEPRVRCHVCGTELLVRLEIAEE
jgi:hypothetical protein